VEKFVNGMSEGIGNYICMTKEYKYLNVQDRIQGGDMHQTIHNTKQSPNHCVTLFIRK
jgi:hypothetical protein